MQQMYTPNEVVAKRLPKPETYKSLRGPRRLKGWDSQRRRGPAAGGEGTRQGGRTLGEGPGRERPRQSRLCFARIRERMGQVRSPRGTTPRAHVGSSPQPWIPQHTQQCGNSNLKSPPSSQPGIGALRNRDTVRFTWTHGKWRRLPRRVGDAPSTKSG